MVRGERVARVRAEHVLRERPVYAARKLHRANLPPSMGHSRNRHHRDDQRRYTRCETFRTRCIRAVFSVPENFLYGILELSDLLRRNPPDGGKHFLIISQYTKLSVILELVMV